MHVKQSHKLYFLSVLTILSTLFSPIILTAIENAGVLPYTIKDNKIYLLLGNDTHRGKFGWGDFGGGAKDTKDAKKSAAIEGHEETMGRFARNLEDPKPENYESEGVQYFIDRCHDDNKVESTDYCFYFVQVPYISSADLNKTRHTLKARHIADHYLEKDDFAWIEGQDLLDRILDTIKTGITHKTRIDDIKKKISLDDAFVSGKEVKYLSKYFIHSMVQPKAIEILQRLMLGDPTVKLQQSLVSLKQKLGELAAELINMKKRAKADDGGSKKKFVPSEEEIKKAAAKTGVSEENVRDYINKNYLGDEPKNYEEFEVCLERYAPKKDEKGDIYITLVEYHITDLKFQNPAQAAIVNAANDGLWAGGGVCGAIFSAANREKNGKVKMQDECNAFDTSPKCPTGEARITGSYGISKNSGAHYVIHAVGPSGGSDAQRKKDLESAYQFSLKVADDPNSYKSPLIKTTISNITQIAFPGISTAIFKKAGQTQEDAFKEASPIAVNAILDYVKNKKTAVKEIYMIAYPDMSFEYDRMKEVLVDLAQAKRLVEAPYTSYEKQPLSKRLPLRFKIIK